MAAPIRIKLTPSAASANNLALSQSPGTAALTLTALAAGPIDKAGNTQGSLTTLGLGRIVGITSGSNDSSIHFTVVGKDQNGNTVTENVTGASGAPGTAVTVNYYTSVTSITPSGSGAAGTVTAGTVNTTASAALQTLELDYFQRIGAMVQVDVANTISYTVQMTFDDCTTDASTNTFFATPASPTALTAQSASKYTQLPPGVCGLAVTIPTYSTTGSITINVVQPSNSKV